MTAVPLDTQCQVCGKPMVVYVEANPFFCLEVLASMATCDACYARRYRKVVEKAVRADKADSGDGRLPYKD